MLSALTKVLADHNANIRYVDLHSIGDRAEIYFEFSLDRPSDPVLRDLTSLDGVASLEQIPSFAKIYGKRIVVMGGGAQSARLPWGAIAEATAQHPRRSASRSNIPLVGGRTRSRGPRHGALPRVKILVSRDR